MLGELEPEGKRKVLVLANKPSSRTISRLGLRAVGLCPALSRTLWIAGVAGIAVVWPSLITGTLLLGRGCGFASSTVVLPIPRDLPVCLRNRTGLLLTAGRKGAPLRLPCLPCFVAWEWDSEVHTSHIVNNMVKLGPILGVIVQSNGGSWRWNAVSKQSEVCPNTVS